MPIQVGAENPNQIISCSATCNTIRAKQQSLWRVLYICNNDENIANLNLFQNRGLCMNPVLCAVDLASWLQSSSIRGLTAPWVILLHWLPLSVTLSTLSKSISVQWMTLPSHAVFVIVLFTFSLTRFLGWHPFQNNLNLMMSPQQASCCIMMSSHWPQHTRTGGVLGAVPSVAI